MVDAILETPKQFADDCIFCKIAQKKIPTDFVYEDDMVMVFRDIDPKAPVHLLLIPKQHCANILEADEKFLTHLNKNILPKIVSQFNLKNGFRLVCNTGDDGGQTVKHLHIHLLAGRALQWPPG